ncbi:hybrid sensor histidine kinase/response regulator [Paraliomyxa miuraensis]|uniref:hybrid sensor histidine kinase/response regulator n=1 Tax=Paraliomyxa miuraensis TaxID=376150 RepID=UPI00224CCB5A|nr:HAMP domain-containing sensor histidine kinase [Paraliomyxa miuraensis]MCX4241918.1 HAMP domain-containing histidine kinase [Paraliomyxa miuraensis]
MMTETIELLVVDDIEGNLVALEALLRRDGLEVLLARSGAEALELLLVHDVALAFIDVRMPDMDGFELAELMRSTERTRHVPIIFVTAGSHDHQRVFAGYEAGAVDFLFKPIDAHVLRSKADVFLELHRQRKALAEVLRLNEMFVGTLGHDLRNPLSAMMTGAELLVGRARDDLERQTLRRMLAAGRRMTGMIDQLLDLTRARLAGGVGFVQSRDRLDVAQIIRSTLEELVAGPSERGHVAVTSSGDCTILGDQHRLHQLFSNLIANALDHGALDEPVSVSIEGDERELVVEVHNHGTIPPDMLPTVFEPFRRRHQRSPKSTGLGLGLFISEQIARAHGGGVEVQSSEAAGTLFTVRLARRREPTPA